MDYSKLLANRTKTMHSGAIHDLLKAASDPGITSLAGGLPDPNTFPVEIINEIFKIVTKKYGKNLYQYSITQGLPDLRQALSDYLQDRNLNYNADAICISPGAQSAIDAAAKAIINQGDKIAVEDPTFLAALVTFKAYEPQIYPVSMEEDGINLDQFAKLVESQKIKLLYIIPNFQNPTGITLSLEKRKKLAHILKEKNILAIEDDPYYELRYHGEFLPPVKSFAPDNVIYIGSFSKILSPGMRLGYYLAPKPVSELMTSTRQGVDVHANNLAQAIAAEYISGPYFEEHIKVIRKIYEPKLYAMFKALEKYFPSSFSWSKPDGGMFFWVTGPVEFDATELYNNALKEKIAIVPGENFFIDTNMGKNTFRLNFTNVSDAKIEKSIKIMGNLLN